MIDASPIAERFGPRLLTRPATLAAYAQSEGHHRYPPPALAAQPESIEEVQALVRFAASHGLSVVGYGAGTSLEGNAAPVGANCLIVDFARMNRIVAVHPEDLLCVVEPGVTREQLNTDLRATGLFFPVDPGANASIGGMISTRASGTTTVRYGSVRDNILALKVVGADGELITTGSHARKSAAGYDLTHLFTGAEGTLGLVVEASLRLHGQPEHIVAATWDFESVRGAVDTVIATIQSGIPIARMELLDEVAIRACNAQSALDLVERPTLFLEFHGSEAGVRDQLDLVRTIGSSCGGGTLDFASDTDSRNRLWRARHQMLWATRAMVAGGMTWTTDVCVPISRLADAIGRAKTDIKDAGLFAPVLGHVGDGNFHVIFALHPDDTESWDRARRVNAAMVDHALSVGGTCTGEHGIGLGKREALLREHGAPAIAAMRRIKQALDPHGLFNPGKIFLDEAAIGDRPNLG